MTRRLALAALVALAVPAAASAQAFPAAHVHVVRDGETLASIAQRYYGDPKRETVLVAENGLATQGGSAIVVGMRLLVPAVRYHRVVEGETWSALAERFYGEARRAFLLAEENRANVNEVPDVGAEILLPYPLRHVASQSDNMRKVAELYYDDGGLAGRLRRFNGRRGNRLSRGQLVLVPLADLSLSDEGRRAIAEETGAVPQGGEVRDRQAEVEEALPTLIEHVRSGRYAEAIAYGNRLLGAGDLTGNQLVTIHRHLAVAYVAYERDDLATEAFVAVLRRQPDLELDRTRTSPKVSAALAAARARLARERAAAADAAEAAEAADAGPPDAG